MYGSGGVTATLSAAGATGSVLFAEVVGGGSVALGTGNLVAGTAMFGVGGLGAGTHTLIAAYAGDGTYAGAQSSAFAVTVTPLALGAVPDAVAMLYGQAVPALTG